MLILNPEKRISIFEAFNLPYYEKYRKMDLPCFDNMSQQSPFLFFQNSQLSDKDKLDLFIKNVNSFHTGIINLIN